MDRESKLCQAEVCMKFCTAVCYNPSQELCLSMPKLDLTMLLQRFKSDGWDRVRDTNLGCLCHTAQGRVAARLTAERLLRQRSERLGRVGTADWLLAGSAGSLLGNHSVQPCR